MTNLKERFDQFADKLLKKNSRPVKVESSANRAKQPGEMSRRTFTIESAKWVVRIGALLAIEEGTSGCVTRALAPKVEATASPENTETPRTPGLTLYSVKYAYDSDGDRSLGAGDDALKLNAKNMAQIWDGMATEAAKDEENTFFKENRLGRCVMIQLQSAQSKDKAEWLTIAETYNIKNPDSKQWTLITRTVRAKDAKGNPLNEVYPSVSKISAQYSEEGKVITYDYFVKGKNGEAIRIPLMETPADENATELTYVFKDSTKETFAKGGGKKLLSMVTVAPQPTPVPEKTEAPVVDVVSVGTYTETKARLEKVSPESANQYKDALQKAVDQNPDWKGKTLEDLHIKTIEVGSERISIAETDTGVFVVNRQNAAGSHEFNQLLTVERTGDNFTFYVKEKVNGKMVRKDLMATGKQGETTGVILKKEDGTEAFMAGSITESGAVIGGQKILESMTMPISNERVSSIFPSAFATEKTAHLDAGGKPVDLKITFALNKSLTTRSLEPVSSVQIHNPDFVNLIAKFYIQDLLTRYNQQNGTSLRYEEYLSLVADGKGQVTIPGVDETKSKDTAKREMLTINPLDGVVLGLTDSGLPVKVVAKNSAYVGKNQEGRLVLMVNGPGYSEVKMQKENCFGARSAESNMVAIYFGRASESITLPDTTLQNEKELPTAYQEDRAQAELVTFVNTLPGFDIARAMWNTQ